MMRIAVILLPKEIIKSLSEIDKKFQPKQIVF